MYDRPLPSSVKLEKYICGALLLESDPSITMMKAQKLIGDDFTDLNTKKIIRAIIDELKVGNEVDSFSISSILPDLTEEILTLSDSIISTANYDTRFRELREITLKRLAYIKALDFANKIYETHKPIIALDDFKLEVEDILAKRPLSNLSFNAVDIDTRYNKNAISSGYITHDWNDGGFKGGTLTLLTGNRGSGKTAFARQAVYACAMQNETAFMFSGENTNAKEKNSLAKLGALRSEMDVNENIAGRKIYTPSKYAIERFDKTVGTQIFLADSSILKGDRVFEKLLSHMTVLYDTFKTRLFVIDNMMQINQASGNDRFSRQTEIVKRLRLFAEERGDTHVVLIVHPKGGDGMQRISGSQEQQNISDTILRYVRLNDKKEKEKFLSGTAFTAEEAESISAVVFNEKVREEGVQDPIFLTYDGSTGTLRELSSKNRASQYEAQGYWVKSTSRYDDEDIPERKDING